MVRSLEFGIHVLWGDGFRYEPVFNSTPDDVKLMLQKIDEALAASKLPEFPDEEPYRDFLLNLRMDNL
jgi:hypothetical protein